MIKLTDEANSEAYKRHSSGQILHSTILLLFVILIAGFSFYTYYNVNNQISGLESQVSTLTASVQNLNAQLADSSAKIFELSSMMSNIGSGDTEGNSLSNNLDVVRIYDQTKDSVVLIKATLPTGIAQGSGFVFDMNGRIITNNHVVEGARSITVTFVEGTIVEASLVGRDPYSDIAVIKVNVAESLLKPLRLGNSSALRVGEPVLAIGNPYGLADTLTSGIISALGREMDSASGFPIVDVIQTDAPINPGNSGGPLLNMRGEVIGINTAIATQTSTGIGFAVPSNTIIRELPSLILDGHYDQAYIGIQGIDVTPSIISVMGLPNGTHGTLVQSITSGGPADKGGLKGGKNIATVDGVRILIGGDVITGADGITMKNFYDLILYIQRYKRPGDLITLNVLRGNTAMNLAVTLGTRSVS